jgi:hypothetical protein
MRGGRLNSRYIDNQELHHLQQRFQKEYMEMLETAGVEYDQQYIFKFFDD